MVGRRSPQNPSVSRLTLLPETIPSCYPRMRHIKFQPHSGRHREKGTGTFIPVRGANCTCPSAVNFAIFTV